MIALKRRDMDSFPMPRGSGLLSPESKLSIYNHFSDRRPLEQILPRQIGFDPDMGIL